MLGGYYQAASVAALTANGNAILLSPSASGAATTNDGRFVLGGTPANPIYVIAPGSSVGVLQLHTSTSAPLGWVAGTIGANPQHNTLYPWTQNLGVWDNDPGSWSTGDVYFRWSGLTNVTGSPSLTLTGLNSWVSSTYLLTLSGANCKAYLKLEMSTASDGSAIVATGYYGVDTTSAAGGDTRTLSGSSGSPNAAVALKIAPTDATASWTFKADGTVWKTGTTGTSQFQSGTEWCDQTPTATYWIRATSNSGSAPTSGTLNSWLLLNSDRTWAWTETGIGITAGSVKIEISTTYNGTAIVATGYYSGEAQVEP